MKLEILRICACLFKVELRCNRNVAMDAPQEIIGVMRLRLSVRR